MKTIYLLLICVVIAMCSCKKELQSTAVTNANSSNSQTDGPVKKPEMVLAATSKSQFVASADGNGSSDFTMNFSAKEAGITIESLTFLAYAADTIDALNVSIGQNGFPGFFQPTSFYPPAKAITHIDGAEIKLPDDGSSVPVTFHVMYRSPLNSRIKSGDTVSIQVNALEYINLTSPYILFESDPSDLCPEMMITGAKPTIEVVNDADILHKGLTKIFTVNCSAVGGTVAINNLPLHIKATNAGFARELVVKDENHHIIKTWTVRGNDNTYTINFPHGYQVDNTASHTFSVYAAVYKVSGAASLQTHLQKPGNFSWTDVAGGRTTPFTTENATYFYNYPSSTVITTHN